MLLPRYLSHSKEKEKVMLMAGVVWSDDVLQGKNWGDKMK